MGSAFCLESSSVNATWTHLLVRNMVMKDSYDSPVNTSLKFDTFSWHFLNSHKYIHLLNKECSCSAALPKKDLSCTIEWVYNKLNVLTHSASSVTITVTRKLGFLNITWFDNNYTHHTCLPEFLILLTLVCIQIETKFIFLTTLTHFCDQ